MALTTLIITDLTRMSTPRVCIGAINHEGRCIRPIVPYTGIMEEWLYQDKRVLIQPFARIELDLVRPDPKPPHTEDWVINQKFKRNSGLFSIDEKCALLQQITDPNVASIFGAEIQTNPGYYLREGEGNRSLGTVLVNEINFVKYAPREKGGWEYRILFTDRSNSSYDLAVTDLAFQYYFDYLREQKHMTIGQIGWKTAESLRKSAVYLRIGLTRPTWAKYPHCCFLQITGVYSFPDYLRGRCFDDFVKHPWDDGIPF